MNPSRMLQRLGTRMSNFRRERELRRITGLPHRTPGRTDVAGVGLEFIDGPSFVSAFRAIFDNHIYRFEPSGSPPSIIDCGANIGLGIVYWKQYFPECRITAFEPDGPAFRALSTNCSGYGDVELINAAVWIHDGREAFLPDGADAGRLDTGVPVRGETVSTVRLSDRLTDAVDLLKLDIEGAEVAVLQDCAPQLDLIENLFVEYHGFAERPQDLDVLLRILSTSGFRWHIQPEYFAATPFLSTPSDRGMDQRLNIFAFKQRRVGV